MSKQPVTAARGFTMLEVMIVAMLTGFMFMMLADTWSAMSKSFRSSIAHARVVRESRMVLESLRRDVGGHIDTNGSLTNGQFVGRLNVTNNELRLCFDGAPLNGSADWGPPDTVIRYHLVNGQLIRENLNTSNTVVVGQGVTAFTVTDLADGVQIDLTVSDLDFIRSYTFVTRDP